MFSPGQQLLTGIAIGISKRNILYTLLPAPLNFIVLQIPCHPAISNPEFINCLIKELLYMKPVIGHSGVGKSRSDNPHHGRRKIQSDLFDRLALGDMNHFKHLDDVFRLRATYHGHKGASATTPRTVSDNSI